MLLPETKRAATCVDAYQTANKTMALQALPKTIVLADRTDLISLLDDVFRWQISPKVSLSRPHSPADDVHQGVVSAAEESKRFRALIRHRLLSRYGDISGRLLI